MLALKAIALLVLPIAAGAWIGVLLERRLGRRIAGVAGLVGCLLLPAIVATLMVIVFPIVGLWDGVTEGLLVGVGIVWAAHRSYADPRNIFLTAGSVVAAFIVLEAATRIFLGAPPAYPVRDGPHFLLSTLLRVRGPDSGMFQHGAMPSFLEKRAMAGDLSAGTMEARPPGAMVTREIVCSIVYGSAYSGVLDVSRERAEVFPDLVEPRRHASQRVLHIGDSMVFGANTPRDQTFTVNLEKLEPDVQHINGGISGMAPDDYFAVLRSWIERERFDVAVMYLFAGNDMVGLDAPHPCSDWQSILVYDDDHARLRFPTQPKTDRRIGLRWLAVNSPLPYLGRSMIVAGSHVAAFSGAMLDAWATQVTRPDPEIQIEHLEAILRTARDELRAKGVAFVVVVLPHADAIGLAGGPSDHLSSIVAEITRKLGVPRLDATEVVSQAIARGKNPMQPDRTHFNEEGHWLMAKWLHEKLPAVAGLQKQP